MATGFFRGDCILKPLKWYRSLHTGRGRRKEGHFLIEGVKAIEQIARSHPAAIDEILLSEACTPPAFASSFSLRKLSTTQFTALSAAVTPQGMAAVVRIPESTYASTLPHNPGRRIVVLDDVQDPGNVGTIIRTAAAFAFSGVLLSRNSADPFSPKAVQASAGALFVPWLRRHEQMVENVALLRAQGYKVYCADLRGTTTPLFSRDDKILIVLGNEGAGISEPLLECADVRYALPMADASVESLNVSVAGAISLYLAYQSSRS